jgi:NAD(P)-dependent dehydrogenase (short-subunit alcohol dehydrogenase family)
MNLRLTDKTALVSGSTKGIGFAIATGLSCEGARVIVNGRSEKAVAEAKQQIVQTQPGFSSARTMKRFPSHDAVIRVYDLTGNVIEAHDNAKEFKEWCLDAKIFASKCESSFFPGTPRKSLACNNVTDKWFF